MDWIISRKKFLAEQVAAPGGSYFYKCGAHVSLTPGEPAIIIDGYIIPRLSCPDKCERQSGGELVRLLTESYGTDFIRRVKGIFSLLVIRPDGFDIYNDSHGMSRFFLWESGKDFVISNRIETVRAYSNAGPDYESMALYCIFEHFILDMTAFWGIRQSMPASRITFDGTLRRTCYWGPAELFEKHKEKHEPEYYANRWEKIIKGYSSEPGLNTSLTLTGGSDSRLVLAGLMRSGAQVNTFTYGDPGSSDAVVSRMVADRLGLDHVNHFVDSPSTEWIEEAWTGITSVGNTLVNLHRAHRYQAAAEERRRKPEVEMLFTGLMGGEYLRGPEYDGYIISEYFRKLNYVTPADRLRQAMGLLTARSVNTGMLDRGVFAERLEEISVPFMRKEKEKEFLLAFYIYGCAHHYQDSLIYTDQFRHVANPFMDPDFLEMTATSDYISFNRSSGIYNLLWASVFQVQLTHLLLPELSDIPYSKRGFYTANDLMGNRLAYLLKRASVIGRRNTFPPNFRYGEWMKEFVSEQLTALSPVVIPLFRINDISRHLQQVTSNITEKEWHYYTNPLNLSTIFKNEKA